MARKASGAGNNTHHLTKDELFAELSASVGEFKLPGGGVITLQSVPLRHINKLQGIDENTETHEALKRICLLGIREPSLDAADLDRMDESKPGLVNEIATMIMNLSGMSGDKASAFLTPIQPSKGS